MTKKIYIVDDGMDNRDFLTAVFAGSDRHIESFENGQSVLARIAQEELPNLIFMDTEMPGKMGYEVCRELKGDERTRGIKIMGTSGNLRDNYEERWKEACADAFFLKPYDIEKLRDKARELLGE